MPFTILDRPFDPTNDVAENGEPWPFSLLRGEETILADHAGELVSFLVDGYEDVPEGAAGHDEALVLRAATAVRIVATIQALLAADAVNEGDFDPDAVDEDTLNILFGDRTMPVLDVDRWEHKVPLVLLATDYEPFTTETTPTGNVLWVDPSDELAFLQSLSNLGVINFYVHEDH